MWNARLDEAQAGIKIAGRHINNLRYADNTTLMAERAEELKSLLMKVKENSGKSWLKTQLSKNEDHDIWSHHFMGYRWGNNGNSERLFILGGSKITVDGDCSHEIKRHLLLGRNAMTNRQYIKKQRHYFANKGLFSQSYGFFPVVMYGCESWMIKKAANWCFWTVVLGKTLDSPLDCKAIQPVNPQGNHSWTFIGRTDAEA